MNIMLPPRAKNVGSGIEPPRDAHLLKTHGSLSSDRLPQ
jgi:hypothetical protein